jgi:hypothetical protein
VFKYHVTSDQPWAMKFFPDYLRQLKAQDSSLSFDGECTLYTLKELDDQTAHKFNVQNQNIVWNIQKTQEMNTSTLQDYFDGKDPKYPADLVQALQVMLIQHVKKE